MHLWSIGGGGWGQSVMKLMQCSGLPWFYGWLEEGWGQSVMKIIQCNGLPEIHAWLTRGSISVVVCHVSVVDWRRRGRGQSVMKIMWYNGLAEIHARLTGGPSAKVGSSAKFELIYVSCFALQKVFSYYIRKT